ncbi:hypothetical protein NIIDNTM18_35190 [Mycolicibacterium litorale]|uniref:Uncharacterized protein n=1 Tax=Mycolicibacterium litorale TaxID=758802 RepID=A0A6S6P9B9_9MYCO|nr:DUF6131 family protein [Mycolicibacterium litorale]BCI54241.1 hypothetical protein NIIDNTM18_35190 [Mycolicibacterium litorale]
MIILGVILAILGYFLWAPLMYIGIALIVIGAVFWVLGSTGRAVGGRKVWY